MRIQITNDAREDLKQIRAYTKDQYGAKQAANYLLAFKEAFKTLSRYPELGFEINHLRAGFRCFRVQYHGIFYTLRGEYLVIVAILHERQLPNRILEQRT